MRGNAVEYGLFVKLRTDQRDVETRAETASMHFPEAASADGIGDYLQFLQVEKPKSEYGGHQPMRPVASGTIPR